MIMRSLRTAAVRVETQARRAIRYLGVVGLSAVLLLIFSAGPAEGTDISKKENGANFEKAHNLPHKATGKNIKIGIIEAKPKTGTTGIKKAANNLGARLKKQYNFEGKNPGDAPVDITVAGGTSEHATLVADIAAGGTFGNFLGVAKEADVYFGGIDNINAYNSFRTSTSWLRKNEGVYLFNLSWGSGVDDNGQNVWALYSDWFIHQYDALMVKSAGNRGPGSTAGDSRISVPGDFFNGITVGGTERKSDKFENRYVVSSYWLSGDNGASPDVRGKPDILAPGWWVGDGKSYPDGAGNPRKVGGTSLAAPHVAGVAAMLMEKGLNLPGPAFAKRNHLAIKAIILNSARKRYINAPENTLSNAYDNDATKNQTSDEDYLHGGGLWAGSTPAGGAPIHSTNNWTPTDWWSDGRKLFVDNPLDDEQGTGLLDAERALIQYDGLEQEEKADNPGGVGKIGWNRDMAIATDVYEFNFSISQKSFITATLTWDRIVNSSDGDDEVDLSDTYSLPAGSLPNLDLFIYFKDELVAKSWSGGTDPENVEHLHYPVPEGGRPFEYSIRVKLVDGAACDYGLAWWTVPEPATLSLLVLGGLALIRRRRK